MQIVISHMKTQSCLERRHSLLVHKEIMQSYLTTNDQKSVMHTILKNYLPRLLIKMCIFIKHILGNIQV